MTILYCDTVGTKTCGRFKIFIQHRAFDSTNNSHACIINRFPLRPTKSYYGKTTLPIHQGQRKVPDTNRSLIDVYCPGHDAYMLVCMQWGVGVIIVALHNDSVSVVHAHGCNTNKSMDIWGRHGMATVSASRALREETPSVRQGFPSQIPRNVGFDVGINKLLNKQWICWWFETTWWWYYVIVLKYWQSS